MKTLTIAILIASFSLVAHGEEDKWRAADLVRPYLKEYMAAIEDEFVYDSEGNFVGPTPHWKETERLLDELLRDQSTDADQAIAYLLFFYTGEHPGSQIVCEASRRGDRILPVIEAYQESLPKTGLEPYPEAIQGSGILVDDALKLIRDGKSCQH